MISIIFGNCNSQEQNETSFESRRLKMVENQIINRGIKDTLVLEAMKRVERHLFVLPGYIDQAYEDTPLPINEGQTISQPYIVALMTESLKLDPRSRVLEIGTGSGYQAAILAEICAHVYTIDIYKSLADDAQKTFKELGYSNITVKSGDGYHGWAEKSPFDAIIVTCSPTHIPEALKNQLAEGGRMIIPVGRSFAQELILLEKHKGKINQKDIIPVRFVPMTDESGKKY
ncbi:MAG: protein-L-isoaspartate(D-aspartate) O-methyltransferase [Bacteroidales bacterium]